MEILIDTREQLPLTFNHPFVEKITVQKIDCGDYCVRFHNGYIPTVRFERKSIGDCYGTMSQGYERFKREIQRAKDFEVKIIILIEGTLTKVLKGYEHSKREPDSIVKQLFTLWEKYDVMPVFCKDRDEMSRYIIEFYSAIGRKALQDLKKQKQLSKQVDKTVV